MASWKRFRGWRWGWVMLLWLGFGVPGNGAPRLLVEPDDGRAPVLALLGEARNRVDLATAALDDEAVLAALEAAAARGVVVRVLYAGEDFPDGRSQGASPAVDRLAAKGVTVRKTPPRFPASHQKVLVVDGVRAGVLTFDLASSSFEGTRDFGVVLDDPGAVAEIQDVFAADWEGVPVVLGQNRLVWSPENAREKLLALVAGATGRLEIYNEELRDPVMLQALVAARKRGVVVRVMAPVLGGGVSGDRDGNKEGRDFLRGNGIPVRAGNVLSLHAKVLLADPATSRALAFVGSQNFSRESLEQQRGLGVLLRDPEILERLAAIYEEDWKTNLPPPRCDCFN